MNRTYCSVCRNPVPEDSVFCPFCGKKISKTEENPTQARGEHTVAEGASEACGSKSAAAPGGNEETSAPQEEKLPEEPRTELTEKAFPPMSQASHQAERPAKMQRLSQAARKLVLAIKGGKKTSAALAVGCGLLLILAAGSLAYAVSIQKKCVSLQAQVSSLSEQADSLSAQNEGDQEKVYTLEHQNQNLRDSLLAYKPRAEYFDALVGYAEEYAVGYSSKNFHASDGLLVMGKDDARVSVTITGTYAATYYMEVLGASTSCEWGETYGGTMTAYIDPVLAGVSAVKFTNSVNSQSFIILCIVE